MFANPISDLADPAILKYGDFYYLTGTTGCSLQLWRSRDFSDWSNAEWYQVYQTPNNLFECWANEMHVVDGWLYFYFSAATVDVLASNRIYALKADTQDPYGTWTWMGRVYDDENWAIDVTVWNYNNKNYMLWSGHESEATTNTQHIWIAELGSPTRVTGSRVKLHSPLPWQTSPLFDFFVGVNEGPEILEKDGRIWLIYSSAGCWTPDYCLSMMWFNGGDPLDPGSWTGKDDGPVMSQGNGVFGPGHNTFAVDNAGTYYVVYHANDKPDGGCSPSRTTRAEPMSWDDSGNPMFPNPPIAFGQPVPAPVI